MAKKLVVCPFCKSTNTRYLYEDADDETLEVWFCDDCECDAKIKTNGK